MKYLSCPFIALFVLVGNGKGIKLVGTNKENRAGKEARVEGEEGLVR